MRRTDSVLPAALEVAVVTSWVEVGVWKKRSKAENQALLWKSSVLSLVIYGSDGKRSSRLAGIKERARTESMRSAAVEEKKRRLSHLKIGKLRSIVEQGIIEWACMVLLVGYSQQEAQWLSWLWNSGGYAVI